MKTSNLVALMVALLITSGGFEGINLLFTHASAAQVQESAALILRS
jgi:hypothetical protein